MSDESADFLLRRLHSRDVDDRRLALTELDEILEFVPVEELLRLLVDEDAAVRKLAVQALEELGDPRAIPSILDAVTDLSEEVGLTAKAALREFRTQAAVPPLLAGIKHSNPEVRAAALIALRDLRNTQAIPALIVAARDQSTIVRREAILALAYLQDPDALPVFRSAVVDPEPEIRRIAIDAVSLLDDSSLSALIGATSDADWQVRAQAASRLCRFRGEQVINALKEALKDDRWEVVKEAIESLGKVQAPVGSYLIPFLFHEIADVRITAASAIADIGDTTSLLELRELLYDPDTGVQKAAARAIARLDSRRDA
jgi:HEAT repeat protein